MIWRTLRSGHWLTVNETAIEAKLPEGVVRKHLQRWWKDGKVDRMERYGLNVYRRRPNVSLDG